MGAEREEGGSGLEINRSGQKCGKIILKKAAGGRRRNNVFALSTYVVGALHFAWSATYVCMVNTHSRRVIVAAPRVAYASPAQQQKKQTLANL